MKCEICVLGGGPAGAAFARRLSQIGHQVVLIEKHPFPRPHIGESLPPGILPLLGSLGLRRQVEKAGFLRPRRTLLRWGEERQVRPEWDAAPGFQVDRGRFDQILLEAARQSGAQVVQPAQSGRPVRNGQKGWIVPFRQDGTARQIRAGFVADASGRRALLGGRKVRCSAPTLALYGYWRGSRPSGPETHIEAGSNEWYWGAPLPDGTFNATVFIDPGRCSAGGELERLYRQLLERSALLRGCLEGRLTGAVTACDATCRADPDPVGEDWIKLGESSLSIDPLSSQGVQAAVRSGIQGAAVANTLARYPEDRAAALQFYRHRQQEAMGHHRSLAARFYGEMAAQCPQPFWQARTSQAPTQETVPAEKGRRRAVLRRGFQRHERLRLSANAQIVLAAVLENDRIVQRPALQHPSLERPVAYLCEMRVAPLLEGLREPEEVGSLINRWSALMPPKRVRQILKWLWDQGVVESAE